LYWVPPGWYWAPAGLYWGPNAKLQVSNTTLGAPSTSPRTHSELFWVPPECRFVLGAQCKPAGAQYHPRNTQYIPKGAPRGGTAHLQVPNNTVGAPNTPQGHTQNGIGCPRVVLSTCRCVLGAQYNPDTTDALRVVLGASQVVGGIRHLWVCVGRHTTLGHLVQPQRRTQSCAHGIPNASQHPIQAQGGSQSFIGRFRVTFSTYEFVFCTRYKPADAQYHPGGTLKVHLELYWMPAAFHKMGALADEQRSANHAKST